MYTTHPGTQQALRRQYSSDRLETASNSRILVLCFDRLDRDLAVALAAIGRDDHFASHQALGHAQDLLGELATMLDVDAWEHAGSLLAVYDYLLRLLASANILKSESMVTEAQRLVRDIGDAFRSAAGTVESVPSIDAPLPAADTPSVSLRA